MRPKRRWIISSLTAKTVRYVPVRLTSDHLAQISRVSVLWSWMLLMPALVNEIVDRARVAGRRPWRGGWMSSGLATLHGMQSWPAGRGRGSRRRSPRRQRPGWHS